MEWFSWTVAVILLISSVVSPIATTIINNKHQSKMKKIEMYQMAKRDALEKYIKSASRCFNGTSVGNLYDYYEASNNLYIYFSKVPNEINQLVGKSPQEFNALLAKIVQTLSKQIEKE